MSYFKVAVLASGSKGNATLIQAGEKFFLIDMGLSCRELNKRMKTLGVAPEELQAIFITHEHSDHIKGLETFTKKYSVPIYSSEATWISILQRLTEIRRGNLYSMRGEITLGEVKITNFSIPHDARDPHGYYFTGPAGEKCTYVTDTGFVTQEVFKAVEGAETLILETNHDVKMLEQGPYPYELKRRILSTLGHLSNESAGELLNRLKILPSQVVLAHLSQENNRPELALATVKNILAGSGKKTNFFVASQDEVVGNITRDEQLKMF